MCTWAELMLLNGDVLCHEMDGEGHEQGKVSFFQLILMKILECYKKWVFGGFARSLKVQ